MDFQEAVKKIQESERQVQVSHGPKSWFATIDGKAYSHDETIDLAEEISLKQHRR